MNPSIVRAEALALSEQLESDIARLEKEELSFEQIRDAYDGLYRPKARALAEEMLRYVPTGDPRLMMVSQVGNLRTFGSDDITMIEVGLSKEVASTHLGLVAKKLRDLTAYLPAEISQ